MNDLVKDGTKFQSFNATLSEKKPFKLAKNSKSKLMGGKAATGPNQQARSGKPGIKKIHMVYLNPSHAGSHRSSSIRSNRSGSR